MAEILLKGIVKRFNELVAVDHVDLDISDKEFLVLLGPSGCGKTTTLRCISGLDVPEEGEIYIDGEDVTAKRASERDIAFVFQLYALYPHFTAYKNIAFPLVTQKQNKKKIKEEVKKAAELLKIEHILNKKPKELSGGDQQRVALGRAIVRRPKVFLLDEPIGTLDASFREEMRTELKRLHVDVGATTVYVTHDQVEAMSMGDRIAIMNLGALQQVGTPFEIYSKPNNLFVANFIGSPGMNFINCRAVRKNGKILLRLNEVNADIHIPEKIRKIIIDKREEDKDLVLGVRPENVIIGFKPEEDSVKTDIFTIEKMGSYNIIDVKLGSEIIRVRTLPTVVPGVKDKAYISFDMDMISLFNRENKQSLMRKTNAGGI
ncbi:MAG TPA: ABC transporter ATP-binding protein [Spirochaetes bacterium]|nr:ABC transporter ATP-binding protein [Spirochaetota bacterium]